jgi:hypothetical protein
MQIQLTKEVLKIQSSEVIRTTFDTKAIVEIGTELQALLAHGDYHLLLDEQGDELFAITDEIAERARKLGARTIRSIGDVARSQRLRDNDEQHVSAKGHAPRTARG